MANLSNRLDVPVFHGICPLVEGSFPAARSIEENAVECLGKVSPLLSGIERDSDMRCSHSFEILEELRYAVATRFVRDDE